MRQPLFVFFCLVVDMSFWDGLGHALSQSGLPHNPKQFGESVGVLVLLVASQLFQWWRTRHSVRTEVRRAVTGQYGPAVPLTRLANRVRKATKRKPPAAPDLSNV